MARRPRPIFIAEAFAVFGIFSLYLLEFLGAETFTLLSRNISPTEVPALSFTSMGTFVTLSTGTLALMIGVPFAFLLYFAFLRPRLLKRF